jgi:hypothetical protein
MGVTAQTSRLGQEVFCVPHNTLEYDGVVFLGHIPGRPYVIAIPGRNPKTLAQVRTCVPDALILDSPWGDYIRVGAFGERARAEQLLHFLETKTQVRGARVIFLRP